MTSRFSWLAQCVTSKHEMRWIPNFLANIQLRRAHGKVPKCMKYGPSGFRVGAYYMLCFASALSTRMPAFPLEGGRRFLLIDYRVIRPSPRGRGRAKPGRGGRIPVISSRNFDARWPREWAREELVGAAAGHYATRPQHLGVTHTKPGRTSIDNFSLKSLHHKETAWVRRLPGFFSLVNPAANPLVIPLDHMDPLWI